MHKFGRRRRGRPEAQLGGGSRRGRRGRPRSRRPGHVGGRRGLLHGIRGLGRLHRLASASDVASVSVVCAAVVGGQPTTRSLVWSGWPANPRSHAGESRRTCFGACGRSSCRTGTRVHTWKRFTWPHRLHLLTRLGGMLLWLLAEKVVAHAGGTAVVARFVSS